MTGLRARAVEALRKAQERSGDVEITQGYGSAATSMGFEKPAAFGKIKWEPGTTNVDIGGGRFDKATNWLKGQGVNSYIQP